MHQISRETYEMHVKKNYRIISDSSLLFITFLLLLDFVSRYEQTSRILEMERKKSLNDSKLYNRTILGRISDQAIKSIYDDEE